jgi:protein TonB
LPEYPPEAARRGAAGPVVLRIHVAASGAVTAVDILESSGAQELDRAARDRVLTWHFHPARRDGKPVDSVLFVPMRFRLD